LEEDFRLFPNPGKDDFFLSLNDQQVIQVKAQDMSGRQFSLDYSSDSFTGLYSIDASKLSSGIYFLFVEHTGGQSVTRMVIE
jgi:hypothetical protein